MIENTRQPLLSLCIPTNGIVEWVMPVLDSIYGQGIDELMFEVVITDNGNNNEFESKILDFYKCHNNIIYRKTEAINFQNQVESFKLASGCFIKFVNHRAVLIDGSMEYLLNFVQKNVAKKPIIFFTNNSLDKEYKSINSFDEFVKAMGYYSSWSAGLGVWNEDFRAMNNSNNLSYNNLFPHITILFEEKYRSEYIVDNRELFYEIGVNNKKKGNYNLFYAFAVEYPSVLLKLYRNNDISLKTFKFVKNSILSFIAELYLSYVILKKECSYELLYCNELIGVFYSVGKVLRKIISIYINRAYKKMIKVFNVGD